MKDPANAWLDKVARYDREEQTYTGMPEHDKPEATEAQQADGSKKKTSRTSLRSLGDFDPNQARDPHGRWTFAGGPAGEHWQAVADEAIKEWQDEHPNVASSTVKLRRDLDQAMHESADYASYKDWYDDHRPLAKELFGDDEPLFEKFLAAGSIQAGGAFNVKRAIEAYAHMKLGGSFEEGQYGDLPAVRKQFAKLAHGEELSGEKIVPFAKALAGDWDQAPADRWMKRLLFQHPQTKGGSWQNDALKAVITAMAKKMEWKPAQLQAAMWILAKSRAKGLGGDTFTYKEFLQKEESRIRSIMHTVHAFSDAVDADIDLLGKLADAYSHARLLVGYFDKLRQSGRLEQRDADWDESKHPRDPRGRFATASGGISEAQGERHFKSPAAESWGELSSKDQDRAWGEYHDQNFDREMMYQEQQWRESGESLDQAKEQVREWWNENSGDDTSWGEEALESARSDYKEETGKEIPYTAGQLYGAIELTGHTASGHVEVKFDDTRLQEPADLKYSKGQLEFPDIHHPDPSGHLTDDMRKHLTEKIRDAFNNRAEELEHELPAPDYSETVEESLGDSWGQMSDAEKFEWTRRNTSIIEGEPEPITSPLSAPRASAEFIAHLKDVVTKAADPRMLKRITFDTKNTLVPTKYGLIPPLAATSRETGEITFYVRNNLKQSDEEIAGTTRHESMHSKWDDVSKLQEQEQKALVQRYGADKFLKFAKEGELPKSEVDNFPVESRLIKFTSDQGKDKLLTEIHDHPVSPYSDGYWAMASREYQENMGGAIAVAVHETLAEIARRHYQEKKLPEGVPTWNEMYTTINDIWEEKHARTAKG